MDTSWGKIIYWAATIISVLIVVVVVVSYVSNASEGEPVIPIIPLLLAGAIWLGGVGLPLYERWALKIIRQIQIETFP